MWRPLLLCGLGLLCLAGFRHAYRPPALAGCDLRNACLVSAHLPGVDFRSVNLSGSDLASADLSEARLQAADLSLANLSMTNFRRADLSDANLRGSNMMGANLANASIEGAVYDQYTTWPDNFVPEKGGARFEGSHPKRTPERPYGTSAYFGRD